MKFFKPKDFDVGRCMKDHWTAKQMSEAANIANVKLMAEGKIVYGDIGGESSHNTYWRTNSSTRDNRKAILINIEPIEKCTHPVEKVNVACLETHESISGKMLPVYKDEYYLCECGAHVKPKEFEVVK